MPGGRRDAVQMTEHGGEGLFESPDVRYLFYVKAGAGGAEQLWRRLLSGGGEHQVLPEVSRGNFATVGERIYFIPQPDVGCDCHHLQWLDLATGRKSPLMDVSGVGGGLSVASDGRFLLNTTVAHTSADRLLVERLR